LGQLSEALTVRLLELEERLCSYENQRQHLDGSGAVLDLLEQTDRRIGRLEGLLVAPAAGAPGGHQADGVCQPRLQVLHAQPEPRTGSDSTAKTVPHQMDDPFPEEGEQPFMDELTA